MRNLNHVLPLPGIEMNRLLIPTRVKSEVNKVRNYFLDRSALLSQNSRGILLSLLMATELALRSWVVPEPGKLTSALSGLNAPSSAKATVTSLQIGSWAKGRLNRGSLREGRTTNKLDDTVVGISNRKSRSISRTESAIEWLTAALSTAWWIMWRLNALRKKSRCS